jgi:hypothetical protein
MVARCSCATLSIAPATGTGFYALYANGAGSVIDARDVHRCHAQRQRIRQRAGLQRCDPLWGRS